jgi:serine/threonine protein phosphatase PrpC
VICPACGASADPDFRFCETCGRALAEPAVTAGGPAGAAADRRDTELAPDLAAVSDRGLVHAHNEDAVALHRTLIDGTPVSILVVCDGVSTSHDPARGSQAAAAAAAGSLAAGLAAGRDADAVMRAAILEAHQEVCALAPAGAAEAGRPLTTIVAAIVRSTAVTVGWVGDSRAYVICDRPRLLTRDDSWVNWAVEQGAMSEAEAMHSPNAHAIVQCLGDPDDPPAPHVVTTALSPGDRLLLCSDGLWNYASTPAALATFTAGLPAGAPAIAACRFLVEFANASGGRDNVTAAMLLVDGGAPPAN